MLRAALFLACVLAVHGVAPTAPSWPMQWTTNWTIFNVPYPDANPPYVPSGLPPAPYSTGTGSTYYDWNIQSMLEVYNDFCVPIFPDGNNWKCNFLNTPYNGINTAFLITFADHPDPKRPPCCVFEQPWHPAPPDFLSKVGAAFNGTNLYGCKLADFWTYGGPPDGPFGYSFFQNSIGGWRIPAAFSFAAVEGWCLQNFFDWAPAAPPAGTFAVPDSCKNAASCGDSLRKPLAFGLASAGARP